MCAPARVVSRIEPLSSERRGTPDDSYVLHHSGERTGRKKTNSQKMIETLAKELSGVEDHARGLMKS